MPTTKVHEYFNEFIESNFKIRTHNLRQIQVLTDLRDSLVPKLLSGGIEIKQTLKDAS